LHHLQVAQKRQLDHFLLELFRILIVILQICTCYGDLDRSRGAKAQDLADDVGLFKRHLRSRKFLSYRSAQTFLQELASRSLILYRNLDDRLTRRACEQMDEQDRIIRRRHATAAMASSGEMRYCCSLSGLRVMTMVRWAPPNGGGAETPSSVAN